MISVVMATYNGAKYLNQQLDSILSQLSNEDEVIISDDHSNDQTTSIINAYQDPRIHLVFNDPLQRGYCANFENALKFVQGDIIFLSDQDDVWLPDKVKLMMNALLKSDFVVSDATVTDGDLNLMYASHFQHANVTQGFVNNFVKTRYIGACMAFNRKVLNKSMPFPPHHKKCPHDYWLALVAEAFFKVQLLNEPLLYYRRHGQNASTGGVAKSTDTLMSQINRRIYCGYHLILRKFTP